VSLVSYPLTAFFGSDLQDSLVIKAEMRVPGEQPLEAAFAELSKKMEEKSRCSRSREDRQL